MTDAVEFYWRPGCPFCMALRGPLRRSGLPLREVDIWKDPAAAARVRSVADGNETVPTVFVGSHAMVNPSMRQVLAAVRDHAPNLAPTAAPPAPVWRPVIAALGFALLWLLLATRTPTTTYHLAPLVVAAAGPVTRRLLTGTPLSRRAAATLGAVSLLIAAAATAVAQWRGLFAGPDVTGGDGALAETVVVVAVGAGLGWWLARRGGRA